MKNITTQKEALTPTDKPIVAWIGIDWADQKHDLFVRFMDGSPSIAKELANQPQAVEEFFLGLHQKHPEGKLAVVVEQSRGPIIYTLMKYSFIELYPINPKSLACYRESLQASGAKSDLVDCQLQADFGAKHPGKLRVLKAEDIPTRKLRLLVEARRGFVDEQTALSNSLGAALKCYYPLVLELFEGRLNTPMLRDFLRRWPTLAEAKRAKPQTLRSFFYKHNARSEELIGKRLAKIQATPPLTEDEAIVDPLKLKTRTLLRLLEEVQGAILEYDELIQKTFQEHSSFAVFDSLPGAGKVLAPRVAAFFGTQRENFPSPKEVQCLSAIAPLRRQSGKTQIVCFRWKRSKFLHQTVVEMARCSTRSCEWARLFFEEKLKESKNKWVAYRALGFKWLRIMWRCWYNNTPYDEVAYLRGLQRKGVKLYESLYKDMPVEPTATVGQ